MTFSPKIDEHFSWQFNVDRHFSKARYKDFSDFFYYLANRNMARSYVMYLGFSCFYVAVLCLQHFAILKVSVDGIGAVTYVYTSPYLSNI